MNQMRRMALRNTLPVLAGFVASGFIYGLLMEELGYPWYGAACLSLLVHAALSQFLVLPLIATQAPLWEIALLTFAANSRFFFYGLGLNHRWKSHNPGWQYPWIALTDESYTLLLTAPKMSDQELRRYGYWVTLFCHIYWVSGGLIGGMLGKCITHDLSILSFVPRALCVVMVVEQLRSGPTTRPLAIAGLSAGLGYWLWGEHFLWGALTVACFLSFTLPPPVKQRKGAYAAIT